MTKAAFWTLLDIIENHLPSTGEKRKRGAVPSGSTGYGTAFLCWWRRVRCAEVHGLEMSPCLVFGINDMLIWMNKTNTRDQKLIGFGPAVFLWPQEEFVTLEGGSFGCEVRMPGAASEEEKLDQEGFLRLASVSLVTTHMLIQVTCAHRGENVTSGPKDAMNFYHSQLRINIECALASWFTDENVAKANANKYLSIRARVQYCNERRSSIFHVWTIMGAYWSYDASGGLDRLNDLLDGGFHMDDHTRSQRRQYRSKLILPCHSILNYVRNDGLSTT
ncbi:hypothetical protein ACHAWO_002152 [Cyclotella atomus]|uniref:Uncharacterized protein n=1 Tax=Cyclotella atomus TaxID=382360 RepID=A0ABD3QQK7_9STRA